MTSIEEVKPPYVRLFCGAPSWVDPSDQYPPPDYCHEADHGEPDGESTGATE